ncbi:MAG: bifunctional phosphoglucose/phosphomannose isomerase [Acidimicrobiia bacterium]|nr:bifunctional phosphoglucose/phosphomannose isomerase [Acidimicrobiia bacterium]
MIESLPDQYRWASELEAPTIAPASTVLVCGMGGSGISGDFVRVVTAAEGVDVRIHKDYGLPAWAEHVRPVVVAVSYSGNTAETLSSVDAALDYGLPVAVVATGGELTRVAGANDLPTVRVPAGMQPRAALGYLVGAVLRIVAAASPLGDPVPMLLEAGKETADLLGVERAGPGHDQARRIADALAGRLVAVWGSAGPTEVAAQRWAKQFHENAKTPAYWSIVPELNHNELVGWASSHHGLSSTTGLVVLRDQGEMPEISRRFRLTADLVGPTVQAAVEVWTTGTSVLARSATASLIGDLVSVYVAEAAGIDPVPVDILTELKNRL